MSCWCISSRSCPLCRSCGWSFYEPSHMTYQLGTHLVPPPVAVRLQVGRNGTAYVPGPWAYNHHTQWLLRWAYQSWQHTVDQRANPPASSAGHWFMLLALRSTNSVSPKGRSPPPFWPNFLWCGRWVLWFCHILAPVPPFPFWQLWEKHYIYILGLIVLYITVMAKFPFCLRQVDCHA